jgi:hypothetical protein
VHTRCKSSAAAALSLEAAVCRSKSAASALRVEGDRDRAHSHLSGPVTAALAHELPTDSPAMALPEALTAVPKAVTASSPRRTFVPEMSASTLERHAMVASSHAVCEDTVMHVGRFEQRITQQEMYMP